MKAVARATADSGKLKPGLVSTVPVEVAHRLLLAPLALKAVGEVPAASAPEVVLAPVFASPQLVPAPTAWKEYRYLAETSFRLMAR